MVVSSDGHGLFDAVTGEKIARDRDPAPEDSTPDAVAYLSCPGLGPITGSRVRIAGLFGGGPHTTTEDGWTLEVVTPAWPNERVLLSLAGVVAHLPLELLHIPRSRLLPLRPNDRRGDEQRPLPVDPWSEHRHQPLRQ